MNLEKIFEPKSVAIIGASEKSRKIGHVLVRNFFKSFEGDIYPVNPRYDKILGMKCFDTVKDISGDVDLAVIAIPAKAVPEVIEQCGEKGVKGSIIISGGFAEVGNKELQDEVKQIADKHNLPVIGPNCLGVMDTYSGVDTLFNPRYKMDRPRQGGISFVTQSGAVGAAVMDWAGYKGFGVSKFISYGNALNIDEVDLLDYLKEDETTNVICAYIEGTKRGKELIDKAKDVSCDKPIITIKAGTTEKGSRAVSSHTASLAGSKKVWEAAIKQSGMIKAKGIDEMFDYARAFAEQPLPEGNNVCIITNGGGFGVLETDYCIEHDLNVTEFEEKTKQQLRENFPDYAAVNNPLDLVGDANAERYRVALEACMQDDKVDSLISIILFQTTDLGSEVVEVISEINDKYDKPLIACSAGGEYSVLHMRLLEEAGVPTYNNLISAARSIAGLTYYEDFLNYPVSRPHEIRF